MRTTQNVPHGLATVVTTSVVERRYRSTGFLVLGPQQALPSSQQGSPSRQHFCTAAAALVFGTTLLTFFAATQLDFGRAASCFVRATGEFLRTAARIDSLRQGNGSYRDRRLDRGRLLLTPQQAFALSQQAAPSVQHFCGALQHARCSAQHFWPFSQQPNLWSASQQGLFGLQQVSCFRNNPSSPFRQQRR